MIIVRIHGGLGNQMFQYALGRHLSCTTGQGLVLETGKFNPSHLGQFDLDKFQIVGSLASPLVCSLLLRPAERMLPRLAEIFKIPRARLRIYRQVPSLEFDEEVSRITGSAYLVGVWQNEKYFLGSEGLIRKEFTLKNQPNQANASRLQDVTNGESVAVHVRRGDYVRNAKTSAFHEVCDEGYYRRAHLRMSAMVSKPRYFVFSDEPAWCRENMRFLQDLTIIDNNSPELRHEDLRIMAACKHFIIANSSFSWWGAWLGTFPRKIVISPPRWFGIEGFDIKNFISSSWITV